MKLKALVAATFSSFVYVALCPHACSLRVRAQEVGPVSCYIGCGLNADTTNVPTLQRYSTKLSFLVNTIVSHLHFSVSLYCLTSFVTMPTQPSVLSRRISMRQHLPRYHGASPVTDNADIFFFFGRMLPTHGSGLLLLCWVQVSETWGLNHASIGPPACKLQTYRCDHGLSQRLVYS